RALAAPGRSVVAIDLPAHGATPASATGGIAGYAAAVEAVLDELDTASVVLVGHSMGAVVALDVAERRTIDAMALLGTGAEMTVNPAIISALRDADEAMLDRWVSWLFAR